MLPKKHGTFYLLPSKHLNDNNTFYITEDLVCILTRKQWRSGKSVLIACEDQSQASRIDEALWIFDKDSFLPHNLFNKNIYNTPIVLYWPQCCYNNMNQDLLINLMTKHMSFFSNFNKIIDFVPKENILKQWARIRYKFYKDIGFDLNITNSSHIL